MILVWPCFVVPIPSRVASLALGKIIQTSSILWVNFRCLAVYLPEVFTHSITHLWVLGIHVFCRSGIYHLHCSCAICYITMTRCLIQSNLQWYGDFFPKKYSQKIPHISPIRERYGLSLVSSLSDLYPILVIDVYIWYRYIIYIYHQISNISHTKYQNLNVSPLVLQLSLPNLLQPGVKSRMKM